MIILIVDSMFVLLLVAHQEYAGECSKMYICDLVQLKQLLG